MDTSFSEKENRRIQRYPLTLPARVEVKIDQKFSWNDLTRLEDISAFGSGFRLKRPVKRGRLLVMSIPMPRQLRCYDYLEPQYRVWGIVRRCISRGNHAAAENYAIGVAFIGKNPPPSFLDDPARLFEISARDASGLWQVVAAAPEPDERDLPADLRRHTRFCIPESLLLEMLDENGDVVASEVTVTENISLGGAAVFTSFEVEPGTFLRIKCDRHNLSIISIVRGKHRGADGMQRLHLEFIDHLFPLEGIG
ncbi:MAG: PilZ domain-containing protein [Acidobacteria bacterium]|nr:PilZ domain-containing protein [Acidobacteriota bacterium]MCA1609101.1 PilZ domain-containing protein [Acidobacteriota bacterium]